MAKIKLPVEQGLYDGSTIMDAEGRIIATTESIHFADEIVRMLNSDITPSVSSSCQIKSGKETWKNGHEEWAESCSILDCKEPGEMQIDGVHFCEEHFIVKCEEQPKILVAMALQLFRALERRDLL